MAAMESGAYMACLASDNDAPIPPDQRQLLAFGFITAELCNLQLCPRHLA